MTDAQVAAQVAAKIAEDLLMERVSGEIELATILGWKMKMELDLQSAIRLCGTLQLAMRHPEFTGPSSDMARAFVEELRRKVQTVFPATADLIALGDPDPPADPETDADPS